MAARMTTRPAPVRRSATPTRPPRATRMATPEPQDLDAIEAIIWNWVVGRLRDPQVTQAQVSRHLSHILAGKPANRADAALYRTLAAAKLRPIRPHPRLRLPRSFQHVVRQALLSVRPPRQRAAVPLPPTTLPNSTSALASILARRLNRDVRAVATTNAKAKPMPKPKPAANRRR
jgi:hypothetical protein